MFRARDGMLSRSAGAGRGAIAALLLAAVGLGILPLSVQQHLLPVGGNACRFEPIDVCGAGDASLGTLADVPTLLPDAVAVVASPAALPAPRNEPAAHLEGFAPGVYRPPRLSS